MNHGHGLGEAPWRRAPSTNELTGTWALARFAARHDRVRIAVWVVAIVLLVLVTAASTKGLYPTQADLDQAAAVETSKAAIAFNGPAVALDTLGGQVAFQLGAFGLTMVGLMTLLMTSRLTRGEEEGGQQELVRSLPVGRYAPLASAIVVVGLMDVLVGVGTTLALRSQGLPAGGSIALGLSMTVLGLAFVGITAVTAQVTENNRVAGGIAGAVLGGSYVLRAVGDMGSGAASWLSPIGWAQKVRPYAGDEWWTLLVPVVAAAVLLVVAVRLLTHRDYGAGLVPPRPGPPTGTLGTPLGLAVQTLRGAVGWWALGLALMGAAYGSVADIVDQFVDGNESMQDLVARSGVGSLIDAFLATTTLTLALIAGGYAVQAALRPRTEEAAGRGELVLSTAVSRRRWLGTHLAVAVVGSALVLAAGGLGTGLTYGLIVGDLDQAPRLVVASLAYVPAVAVLVGIAAVLHGLSPRWAQAAWALVAGTFVIGFFRELLGIPQWLADLSPFERTPLVPAVGFDATPVVALAALALALGALGLGLFGRRDIGA
jgi:ABC-2 type transport system permease protein